MVSIVPLPQHSAYLLILSQRRSSLQIWLAYLQFLKPILLHELTSFQSEEMQQQAIDVAQDAMQKYSVEKDIAQYIKKEVRQNQSLVIHAEKSIHADEFLVRRSCRGNMALHRGKELRELRHTRYVSRNAAWNFPG